MLSGATSAMFSGAMNGLLGDDDMDMSPIPSFYFDVDCVTDPSKLLTAGSSAAAGGGLGSMLGAAASAAMGAVMSSAFLTSGEWSADKAFIEVSGLDMGLEGKKTFNEGGNNYPIDLPDKMKNTAMTLKRLIRPAILNDKWTEWYKHTFEATSLWIHPIEVRIVQICIMHPHKSSGEPTILATIDLYNAYPSKVTWSSLNSTSEDLLVEEIEISYAFVKHGLAESVAGTSLAATLGGIVGGAVGGALGGLF